jgi:hypothetical protein
MIRSGRHPHEVCLLGVCVLSGATGLINYSKVASSTVRALPEPWGMVFYATMLAGAVIALAGVLLPGLKGPLIERSGLLILASLFTGYGIAVLAAAGARGLFFSAFVGGFAIANLVRYVQIGRELRRISAAATLTSSTDQLGER